MTVNSELVLNYLKKNYGVEFTKNEIAEALGISVPAVTGSVNGLVRNNLAVERKEEIEVEPATETRKAKMKTLRHVQLTVGRTDRQRFCCKREIPSEYRSHSYFKIN